ncbi:MAG: amino acid ABC transporter permease [Methanobacteriota archaeon]
MYLLVGRRGFDTAYMARSYPLFLEAAKLTLYATTLSYVLGMGIGFLIGWARSVRTVPVRKIVQDHRRWQPNGRIPVGQVTFAGVKYFARRVADGYVEIIRGTPLLVQIVFAWSVLLVYSPRLENLELIAGIAALTANTGGYQGEIFRAGLRTVHSGQVEAARALGLSRWSAMRRVVFPQALRLIIPPLTNEYLGLLKASSLLTVIGIEELARVGREQAFLSARVFEGFLLVTGIYLLITVPLSKVIEYLERRYRIPGLGIQQVRETRVGA